LTVLIRQAKPSDLPALVEILNPFITDTAITFDTEAYSTETRQPWFAQFGANGRYQCFVAEMDKVIVGYANSGPLRPKKAYDTSVEVSIYKDKLCTVRGIGSALYEALFAALLKQDVHRAHALITLPNNESVALHQKFGFKEVGLLDEAGRKFRKYHSVYWMEKKFNLP